MGEEFRIFESGTEEEPSEGLGIARLAIFEGQGGGLGIGQLVCHVMCSRFDECRYRPTCPTCKYLFAWYIPQNGELLTFVCDSLFSEIQRNGVSHAY